MLSEPGKVLRIMLYDYHLNTLNISLLPHSSSEMISSIDPTTLNFAMQLASATEHSKSGNSDYEHRIRII